MRELKVITETTGIVDAADKFDDMYLRIEALANHANDIIKYAGDEKLVGDWWTKMQDALQSMQGVSQEIRQPRLPGMEESASEEVCPECHQDPCVCETQETNEETQMEDIDQMISKLSALAGIPVTEGSKPDFLDLDKDGNKKEPMKKAADDAEEDLDEKAKNPYAIGMAQAMKSTGDEPPLEKSTIKKAHEIAKAVKKNESVELDECGMPMMAGGMEPDGDEMSAPASAPQGDVYQLNVQTPTKVMTFVTDNPEEIIQVLKASGVKVQSTETVGYQPPKQEPAPAESPMKPAESKEEKEEEVAESVDEVAHLRRLLGLKDKVEEGKFANSVDGPKGDPAVVGDTIDFAVMGTGGGKSGRGDKGLSTMGDNPMGRNDRDLTESLQTEFSDWLKQKESK